MDDLAKRVGVVSIYVKDESCRFGLNAFKALGGSYAIGNCIAKRLGISLEELPFGELNQEHAQLKEKLCLNEHSRVLCFSTEGDTDRENYRRIVWDMAI